MAEYNVSWVKQLINGVWERTFAFAHAKSVYTDFANKKTLADKLVEIDTVMGNKADSDAVPTKVSQLTNDSNYQTDTEVTDAVSAGIAKVVAGAPESLDTLKEISDWISGHKDDAGAMNSAIKANTKAIEGKVDKVDGKGLSTNDYTAEEKTKLAEIADGANKTVVDSKLSSTSENPVQNKIINNALAGKAESIVLASNVDLNNITTPGIYSCGGGNSISNKPSGVDAIGLIVVHNASGAYYTQILTTSTNANTYRRTCINGTWSAWSIDEYTDNNTTYNDATTSAHGLMTAAMVAKLNGIATGANKTTVDSALSSTSANPVQNKVVNTAIGNKMNKSNPTGTGNMSINGTASGTKSTCIGGFSNETSGNSQVVIGGQRNKVTATDNIGSSIIGGIDNKITNVGYSSIIGGTANAIANKEKAVILGGDNNAVNAENGVAIGGSRNTVNGTSSVASGFNNETKDYQFAMGHYNNKSTTGTTYWTGQFGGTILCIGNGTDTAANNAFRFQDDGNAYGTKWNTSGADYAELFEWADGNKDNEDRVGCFVTLEGKMIRKANRGDYILGVVSGAPGVLGNADEQWMGRFKTDDFGRQIFEKKEVSREIIYPVFDEKTGEKIGQETTKETAVVPVPIENENYDAAETYIPRSERPEWDAVGLMGVLPVRDDGTCIVNGFCEVVDGGAVTASGNGYRVIERINDHVVKIVLK